MTSKTRSAISNRIDGIKTDDATRKVAQADDINYDLVDFEIENVTNQNLPHNANCLRRTGYIMRLRC